MPHMACFSTLSTFVLAKKIINVEDFHVLIQISNLEDASSSQNILSLMTAAVTKAFIQTMPYAACSSEAGLTSDMNGKNEYITS